VESPFSTINLAAGLRVTRLTKRLTDSISTLYEPEGGAIVFPVLGSFVKAFFSPRTNESLLRVRVTPSCILLGSNWLQLVIKSLWIRS
jgi:hypothetical protein